MVTGCVDYRQRLVADTIWLHAACGYTQKLVTGNDWFVLQAASGYGRRLGAGGVWLRKASGYGQRLVTDRVWLATEPAYTVQGSCEVLTSRNSQGSRAACG